MSYLTLAGSRSTPQTGSSLVKSCWSFIERGDSAELIQVLSPDTLSVH